MRVLLTTYGLRWDVQPLVGLAVQVQRCAPPDQELVELMAGVGAPLVPIRQPVRPPVTRVPPLSALDLPPRAVELVAAQFDTVAAAAEEGDASVAIGVMPTAGWR